MDGSAFDQLTRKLGKGVSRRSALKALIGGATGLVVGGVATRDASARTLTICHATGDTSSPYQAMTIDQREMNAHARHGDFLRVDCCSDSECPSQSGVCGVCTNGYCIQVPGNSVDCGVSWSEWSACSATCGGGEQSRTGTITTEASCGGAACPALEESRACNEQACELSCDAVLSGTENGGIVCVDDEMKIYVNDSLVFEHLGTTNCFAPIPLGIVATGDSIRVVANNSAYTCGDISIDPLYLICQATGAVQALDPIGYPGGTQAECGEVFYDKTFIVEG